MQESDLQSTRVGVVAMLESDFTSVASTSTLRTWDARKISKFLLSESENYDSLFACILSQLNKKPGESST